MTIKRTGWAIALMIFTLNSASEKVIMIACPFDHALLAFMPTNQHIVKQNRTAPISFSGVYRIFHTALPGDDMFTPLVDHLLKIEGALRISVEDDSFYFYIFVERKRYDRLIKHGNLLKIPRILVSFRENVITSHAQHGHNEA